MFCWQVTLFHFDLPQPLQDLGGLPNDVLVGYFTDYAEFAFKSFGKKVSAVINKFKKKNN